MKATIRFLIIVLFITSCQFSKDRDQNKLITFDLTRQPEISAVTLSDLKFFDIVYIPLETNEQSVMVGFNLSEVWSRFIAGNDTYIIKQFNTILKFRYDGSFVSKIGTEGRGPDEFLVAHDIDIDKENQELYLVSAWQEKFNVYSRGGEFLRTFKIPFRAPVQFRYYEDIILCYFENIQGNVENSFVALDTLGRIIKNFPNKYPFTPNKKIGTGIGRENLFYQFNNQLFKKEVYSDTIYLFANMVFKPHIVITVGNRLLTPEARAQYDLIHLSENYVRPINLIEFGDYIYYEYNYKIKSETDNPVYGFIGSKTTGSQTFINAKKGISNDLDGGPDFVPIAIIDDRTVISWIDAIKLKNHVASEAFKNSIPKYPEKKKALEKLANDLNATDNPILMMAQLEK